MIIFYICFGFIFLLSIFLKTNTKKQKILYLVTVFSLLTIIAVLRKYNVGYDLEHLYWPKYKQISETPWKNLKSTIHLEIGYVYFCKIIDSIFPFSYQVFIVITSLITIPIIGLFIYKCSENVKISSILYILLNMYFMSMNIIRQQISVSIIIIAFFLLRKNNKIWALFLLVLAGTFHASSLVMVPLFLLYGKKYKKIHIYITLICTILLLIFYKEAIELLGIIMDKVHLSNNKNYSDYLKNDFGKGIINLNSISSVMIALAFYVMLNYVWIKNEIEVNDVKIFNFLLFASSMYLAINVLSLRMVIVGRLSHFLNPFVLLMVPISIKYIKNLKFKLSILITMYIFIGAKFLYIMYNLTGVLYGIYSYSFFWN